MPYVIALCHQKGGVAKTTTPLALGACRVEQQCETLLIAFDPQANLTTGMGLNPADLHRSAADVLLGNETMLRVSGETGLPGLDLVPSNADRVTVAQYLYLRAPYEYILRDRPARRGALRSGAAGLPAHAGADHPQRPHGRGYGDHPDAV